MPAALAFLAVLVAVALVAARSSSAPEPAPIGEGAPHDGDAASLGGAVAELVAAPGELVAASFDAGRELLEQVSAGVRRVFQLPASAAPYADAIARAESDNGIPQSLLGRLLYQESRFRPEIIDGRVKSPAGAVGIAQFMPATARDEGVNPLNPDEAIAGAGRYLAKLRAQVASWDEALAAYNWGIGNVKRRGLAAAPTETQNYVAQILSDVEV